MSWQVDRQGNSTGCKPATCLEAATSYKNKKALLLLTKNINSMNDLVKLAGRSHHSRDIYYIITEVGIIETKRDNIKKSSQNSVIKIVPQLGSFTVLHYSCQNKCCRLQKENTVYYIIYLKKK